MFRQFKVLATCVLVVLLGIPVGYVCIAWRPVDPFGFCIVGDRVMESEFSFHEWSYEVEVRNSSSAVIHLNGATVVLSLPDGPELLGHLKWDSADLSAGLGSKSLVLPAHSTVRCRVLVPRNHVNDISVEGAEIHYTWQSDIRMHATKLGNSLKRRLHLLDPNEEHVMPDNTSTLLKWSSDVPRRQTQPKLPPPRFIKLTP